MNSSPAILGGQPVRPQGPPEWPILDPHIEEALKAVYASGNWGRYLGPNHERLIRLLAEHHGVSRVHLCSSGTAAVELALRGVGVGPGDEVLMAAYDFKANFQDILAVGAIPVLVDVRKDNWNLDGSQLSRGLTSHTKAVLVSHLHGGVVDMPAVCIFAMSHGLAVIEDACQMPGARIHGRRAGTWGDVGVLSFGGSKLTTAGRGGAVLTSRDDVAQRIHLHTHRGNDVSPLSELQAAVLIPQWERLDEWNARRNQAVDWLRQAFASIPGLTPFAETEGSLAGYYKLGFQYDPAGFGGLSRDRFAAAIRAEGIALDPGFRALHRIHSARRFRTAGDLPEADRADAGVLTLHHPVLLGQEADWRQIPEAVEKIRRCADQLPCST